MQMSRLTSKKKTPTRASQKSARKSQRAPTRNSAPSAPPAAAATDPVGHVAEALMPVIQQTFAKFAFTRDDLLTLISDLRLDSGEPWAAASYGINDYTTGTRYRKVCHVTRYLVDHGHLAQVDWLRLCLPELLPAMAAGEQTELTYLETVRRLVEKRPADSLIDAMTVVRAWKSDQHLPQNIKRMTVRAVFPHLEQAGVLRRGPTRQYVVSKASAG